MNRHNPSAFKALLPTDLSFWYLVCLNWRREEEQVTNQLEMSNAQTHDVIMNDTMFIFYFAFFRRKFILFYTQYQLKRKALGTFCENLFCAIMIIQGLKTCSLYPENEFVSCSDCFSIYLIENSRRNQDWRLKNGWTSSSRGWIFL